MNESENLLTSNQINLIKWIDRHTEFNLCEKMYLQLVYYF